MNLGICPECDAEVRFKKAPWLGQRTACPRCGTALEVVSLGPLELDWAFEEPIEDQEIMLEDVTGDDGFA
jgi:lysine biosynthesis protein LysW